MSIQHRIELARAGRILWPSLGNPRLIATGNHAVCATVVVKREAGISEELTNGFRLTAVGSPAIDVPLATRCVRQLEDVNFPGRFWPAVLRDLRLVALKITLEAVNGISHPDVGERRVILFNLSHEALEGGRHSVAYAVHGWSSCRFLYAADLHLAAAWDEVERRISSVEVDQFVSGEALHSELLKAFARSTFSQCFVNPNRNFASLLRSANEMARAGDLDFVIFGGDIIDYVNKWPRKHRDDSYRGSNYSLFESMVTGDADGVPLEVPLFTQTGNHDYRLWPYRFSSYGLRHCGLHDLQTRFLLGLKRRPAIGIPTREDIDSISARVDERHSLTDYLWRINPKTDYALDIGDVRFVFLDTGRDALLAWRRLSGRWRELLRSLKDSVGDMDSEGLWQGQIDYLREQLLTARERSTVLLLHAPLFNPVEEEPGGVRESLGDAGERLLLDLEPLGDRVSRRDAIALERRMFDEKLRKGCIFQNHASVLQIASRHKGAWLALSGHIHRNVEVRLDRRSGQVFQGDYTSHNEGLTLDRKNAYFLTPTALGHVQSHHEAPGTPMFYEVEIAEGRIERVVKHDLLHSTDPARSAFFVRRQNHTDGKLLRITLHELGDDPEPRSSRDWLAVTFWVMVSRESCRESVSPVKVVPLDEASVRASGVDLLPPAQSVRFFGEKLYVFTQRFHLNGRGDALFLIKWHGSRGSKAEIVVTAEMGLTGAFGSGGLRAFWHPSSFFIGK